jgi:arylsulfatase A-like enzyme
MQSSRHTTLLPVLLIGLLALIPTAATTQESPHIVYILADDIGFADVQVNNPDSDIPTPNINKLAEQGRNFTNAHSTSAVCTPTRYGVLTGRYNWRSDLKDGVLWGFDKPLIDADRMTVASLLANNGYYTAVVGKWHLGLGWQGEDVTKTLSAGPTTIGFDHSYIFPNSGDIPPYVFVSNLETVGEDFEQVSGDGFGGTGAGRAGPKRKGLQAEDILPEQTKEAVRVIRKHGAQRTDQRLFLYFPLTAPHRPVAPSKRFQGETSMGKYGDFVHQVDWTVGQVMKALDQAGMAENTLVIFTGDNGASPNAARSAIQKGHKPSKPFRGGKTHVWEGGHREPFIAHWPGQVKAGTRSNALVSTADLMATAADLVNFDLPDDAGEDSRSMLPLLLDEDGSGQIRESAVYHSQEGHFAIQMGKWKLITVNDGGGWADEKKFGLPSHPIDKNMPMQLYNIKKDPKEHNNLYNKRPKVVKKLKQELIKQVNYGRSTPGEPQLNDGDYWKQLNKFMSKDQYRNEELVSDSN